jgi:uridine phosphorylase
MGKIERIVVYGLLTAFGIATACMFVVVLNLRSTAQTAAAQVKTSEQAQVSATAHIQWVVPGSYPNNLADVTARSDP